MFNNLCVCWIMKIMIIIENVLFFVPTAAPAMGFTDQRVIWWRLSLGPGKREILFICRPPRGKSKIREKENCSLLVIERSAENGQRDY